MRLTHPLGRKSVATKHQAAPLRVKSVGSDGVFEGYGSVFGVEDSYGDIVAPGAFADTLTDLAAKGRRVPVLWQHDTALPIGAYDEVREDDHGLYVRGHLLKDDVAQAREAFALMKAGAVDGLSIGYWVRESSMDEKTWVRTLLKLDLVEVSVVTFPACDDARVEAVKRRRAHSDLGELRSALSGFSLPSLKL